MIIATESLKIILGELQVYDVHFGTTKYEHSARIFFETTALPVSKNTARIFFETGSFRPGVDFLGFLVPTITIRQYITGTARARAGEPGNLSAKCARTRALTNHHGGVGGAVHLEGSSEGPEGAI
jgi:hypothetical protein